MIVANDLIADSFPAQTSSSSCVIWSQKIVRASFQVSVSSGTLSGTFTLQASNDQATGKFPNQFIPTNWSVVGSSTTVIASSTGAAATFMIPATELSFEYLRLVYTANAANGIYSVRMKTEGF